MSDAPQRQRIDKWLWAARFFKTRTLATRAVNLHRVRVGGDPVKPARELRVGDVLTIERPRETREVVVRGLSLSRGPASVAQALYAETARSVTARERLAERRRLAPEPARTIAHGRPTKRERRALERERKPHYERWSAALDDD